MQRKMVRLLGAALLASGLVVGTAGAALAVSGGGFSPSQMDCTQSGDAQGTPAGVTHPGCHFGALNLADGDGNRYAELGLDELPDGGPAGTPTLLSLGYPGNDNSPHAGCLSVNTNGTGGGTGTGCGNNASGLGFAATFDYYEFYCPIVAAAGRPCQAQPIGNTAITPDMGTANLSALVANIEHSGLLAYFGFDDNSDAGEHDGVDPVPGQTCTDQACTPAATNPDHNAGSINGPSDGGGSVLTLKPQDAATAPSLTDLLPLLGLNLGSCADGNCEDITTSRQTVYQGCSPADDPTADVQCSDGKQDSSRNAADYTGKQFDPESCSSGDKVSESPGPQGCGPNGMDSYRQSEAHNVYAEPGISVYEDPDPEGSPAGLYPDPGVYIGTCGVILGGGQTGALPASPLTNSAGQLDVPTGC